MMFKEGLWMHLSQENFTLTSGYNIPAGLILISFLVSNFRFRLLPSGGFWMTYLISAWCMSIILCCLNSLFSTLSSWEDLVTVSSNSGLSVKTTAKLMNQKMLSQGALLTPQTTFIVCFACLKAILALYLSCWYVMWKLESSVSFGQSVCLSACVHLYKSMSKEGGRGRRWHKCTFSGHFPNLFMSNRNHEVSVKEIS